MLVFVESFDSSFEKQVSDPDEFDFSFEFFNSCDTEFSLADSPLLIFAFLLRLILLIINPRALVL